MEEAHYDIPWEFVHRKGLILRNDRPRSACADSVAVKPVEKALIYPPAKPSALICAPAKEPVLLIHNNHTRQPKPVPHARHGKSIPAERKEAVPSTSEEVERSKLKLRSGRISDIPYRREKFSERDLIHYGIDRVLAEDRLIGCELGKFLVRLRENNSLALSIRANNRVLHIKLELRNNRWVLGEGPSFGSVGSVITFYQNHELPIRGAEHIVLTSPVLATNSYPC